MNDLTEKDEWNLDIIAQEIGDFLCKWGRISVTQTKEKYGTVRVYCSFYNSLHSMIWPGYVYRHPKCPDWLWNLSYKFHHIPGLFWYQKIIYRLAYKKVIKKYPKYHEEILRCADYKEFLKDV
jgi:hypothetical protein